jgi:hypothetical protein
MKKCVDLSIGTTTIRREIDEYPDLSFYGEYTSDIKPGVIIREHNEFYEKIHTGMERDIDGRFIGKKEPEYSHFYGRNEYPGFKPYAGGEKIGTKEYYLSGMADYERMEKYNRNHWYMINIVVTTHVYGKIPSMDDKPGYTEISDTISNSLSNVESDGGKEYLDEIISDLKSENKADLLKMGFSEAEIDQSLNNAETKEEW